MGMPDRISEIMHPARLYNVEKKLRLSKVVTDFLVFQGVFRVFGGGGNSLTPRTLGTDFVLDKSPEILALIEGVPRAPTDEKVLAELGERLCICVCTRNCTR